MEEENRKGPGIFYAVVSIATLVVAIIGATFAWFSATTTGGDDAITGQTAEVGGTTLSLVVTEETTAAKEGDLIPLDEETQLEKALGKNCQDDKGYTVCHVYKVVITNSGSIAATMTGTFNLTSEADMKWRRIEDATTLGSPDEANTAQSKGSALAFASNKELAATNGSETYYIVVWLEEAGGDQTDADSNKEFSGTITFDAVGGGHLTATFNS